MNLGRDKIAGLEQKLEEADSRVDETAAAIATAEAALSSASAERGEAIEDPSAYAKLGAAVDDHRAELARLKLLLAKRHSDADQVEGELARARYQAAANAANAAGERVAKASETVAELVDQLANVCDKLVVARDKHRDARARADELAVPDQEESLVYAFDEAGPSRLAELLEFLEAERERWVGRAQARVAIEESGRRHAAIATAEKRAREIVEKAYDEIVPPPRGSGRPQFNELLAGEPLEVEKAVQRLVHERERARVAEGRASRRHGELVR